MKNIFKYYAGMDLEKIYRRKGNNYVTTQIRVKLYITFLKVLNLYEK